MKNISSEEVKKNWNNTSWWAEISAEKDLTAEFINKYADKLDWKILQRTDNYYSEAVIDNNFEKYEFIGFMFTLNPNLSLNFIKKHLDDLNVEDIKLLILSGNKNITEEFIEERWDDIFKDYCVNLIAAELLSEDFIKKHNISDDDIKIANGFIEVRKIVNEALDNFDKEKEQG